MFDTIEEFTVKDEITRLCNNFINETMCIAEYVGLMNSKNPRDRMVGEIMYMWFNFECDGKINALYGELMSVDNVDDMWKTFKNSDTYAFLKTFKEYSNLLTNEMDNQDFKNKLIQDHKIKINDLLNNVNYIIKKLENKIGKIWLKAQHDYKEKHNIREIVENTHRRRYNTIDKNVYNEITNSTSIYKIIEDIMGFPVPLSYY